MQIVLTEYILKFERIFKFLLPSTYLYRRGSKMWKDSIGNIFVIFQTKILRKVGLYVRRLAIMGFGQYIVPRLISHTGIPVHS